MTFVWPAHLEARPGHRKAFSRDRGWRLREADRATAHFPSSSQAEGRRVSDLCIFYPHMFLIIVVSSFKGISGVKSFPPTSPGQQQWRGQGACLCGSWRYLGTHQRGFLANWSGKGWDPGTATWTASPEEVRELSKIGAEGRTRAKDLEAIPQTQLYSAAQDGGASLIQEQRGPGPAWPARSSKGLTRKELLSTTERAKDRAKSAISTWEGRFSQNTTPSPLSSLPCSTSEGKGDKRRVALEPGTDPRALRTLWSPSGAPHQCSKCQRAGAQGQEPGSRGPGWPGRSEPDPTPISNRTPRPTLTAGFVTVGTATGLGDLTDPS